MRINSNLSALTSFNALTANTNSLQKVIKQVSTGLRINSAADDAAGLAISENIRAQSLGIERAMKNAQDGISLLQTAEGALGETNSMLQRMRELAVQAANDTLTSQDRNFLQMEIDELKANIDRIAGNTQFNTKRLLDGSLCGTWSSTDSATKAYIRGEIEAEGNYRIEVRANPGAAQVQKSNIFKIKHENVATDVKMNADNGAGGVVIDSMPAGYYNITATKAGGGEPVTTYDSTATIEVVKGNGSGVDESLYLRITGETKDGTAVYWPYNGGDYYNGNRYREINVPSSATSKEDVAALIKNQLDGKEFTLASDSSGSNATTFTLQADTDGKGNCIISASSTEGKLTSTQMQLRTGITSAVASAGGAMRQTEDVTVNVAELQGKVRKANSPSDETINIAVTYDGTTETHTVNVPAGTNADDTAALLRAVNETLTIGGKSVTLTGESVGASDYYKLTAKADDDKPISITTSVTPSSGDAVAVTDLDPSDSETNKAYTTTYADTVIHKNTSSNTERARIRVYDGSDAYYISTGSPSSGVNTDIPADSSEEQIAQIIYKAVQDAGKVEVGGKRVLLESTHTSGTADFSLRAVGSAKKITFSVFFLSPDGEASTKITDEDTSTTSVIDATFSTEETYETTSGAVASLTGFYGSENAESTLSAAVNTNTQNNASILFEVTGSTYDETLGVNTITLSASSHVLTTDGTTANHTNSKITFSTSDTRPVDVSDLLGESAGALTLTLDPSQFSVGDKFVYNVSGNGTSRAPSDTSLYINGSQDSTWPLSWGTDGYITHENNSLYYNVNAQAVSNRDLHFRSYYLNSENGKVHDGDIILTMNSDFGTKAANFPDPSSGDEAAIGSFTANYVGKIAAGTTKLRDLEQFWNTQTGVFMLEQPQVLTVSQNDGKKASITLNASDTLNDVRDKLNQAISEGLGQGVYTSGSNANNFVTFVETPTDGGMETVKGTMLVRSVIPGYSGELTFSSAYGEIIDALGLNTIQSAQETSYTASVYNAHDGAVIAQNVKTSGNMLKGVIGRNIDVEFDAMSGVNAVWSDKDKNFILTPEEESRTSFLHIVKNNISFQTGSNKGEKISLDIGDMSSAGLGVKGVNLMTSQRASEAIGVLDEAIRNLSAQRTKIGTYQNELEHTLENLTAENTGLVGAESRIRDADMSKSMMDLVKFQIIHQSGTSMLAQANQVTQSVLGLIQ